MRENNLFEAIGKKNSLPICRKDLDPFLLIQLNDKLSGQHMIDHL